MQKETLSQKTLELMDRYFNLNIGGKLVKCPYYINHKSRKADLRSLVGKGSPSEIEDEVKIWAKVKKFDLQKENEFQIRQFMRDTSIGIDCSGLVSHLVQEELRQKGKSLSSVLKNSFGEVFWKRWFHKLRFLENLSVETIANEVNVNKIPNLKEIKPLDMLHLRGFVDGFHILLVFETGLTKENKKYIKYVHSTKQYYPNDGVRIGQITLTSESKDLSYQTWEDEDEKGINFMKQSFLNDKEEGYFMRLRNV